MSDNIPLHPEKGLNPRMSVCANCGKDVGLILLGSRDWKIVCSKCDATLYGFSSGERCPRCNESLSGCNREQIGEHEKIPGDLCEECGQEEERFLKLVQDGGIYFRCTACKKTGVIRKEAPLAAAVREKMGVQPPDVCGVEFTNCEEHTPKEQE